MRFAQSCLIVAFCSLCSIAAADEKELPQLVATSLKDGMSYKTDGGAKTNEAKSYNTWGKIIQIIDDESMLIGIDNGGASGARYSVVVMCKFPTNGLTDDQTGFLKKLINTEEVTVAGTTRYKTTGGGTKTVFVLEPRDKKKKK